MSLDADQLFGLLPAVYRTRDAANGGPLKALFAVMAAQGAIVEENIQQLYDDQFIETCAAWVVPYIGDLVGYNSVYELGSGGESRAEVANTIGSRRRKGTLLALEQVAIDVSGRAALAVEEYGRLITTASMRLVATDHSATVDLRDIGALALLDTPFETSNHTIDVRRIAPRLRTAATPDTAPLDIALHGPGRFDIADVAIHLWRWQQSFQVVAAPAFVVDEQRYMFSPLGADMPLFSNPAPRTAFTSLTTRSDVPAPIARSELLDYYGGDGAIVLIADGLPVGAEKIHPANLADRPGGSWCTVPAGKIAVDAELGRIQYAPDVSRPDSLLLTYSYGFPAAIGGGPYDRTASLAQLDSTPPSWSASVGSPAHPTLASAVAAWNVLAPGSTGTIILPGFSSAAVNLTGAHTLRIPAESNLTIVAGGLDQAGNVSFNDSRAILTGDIEVSGIAGAPPASGATAPAGQLVLSGVWLAGQLVVSGAATTIQIADSTLVPGLELLPGREPMLPGEPSIVITAPGSTLVMNRAISGPIAAAATGSTRICASIIDATSATRVAYGGPDLASAGADLHVEDSTIIGKVRARTIALASNTIFLSRLGRRDPWPAAVWASRKQSGCVRFCLLPFDSITPGRYNCLAPDAGTESALEPSFVSLRYGDPAYALLSGGCPMAIWTGADNGSQIGAYLQIQETEAVRNVQLRAPEYLPVGLESGVFLHPSRPEQEPLPALQRYAYGWRELEHELEAQLPGIGAGLI